MTEREPASLEELLRKVPYRPGALERFAVGFLRRRANDKVLPAPAADDPVHVLTPAERAEVRRVVRLTILRALVVGIVSAAIVVSASEVLEELEIVGGRRWLWLGLASVWATIFEITTLYYDHLAAVVALMGATGARIVPSSDDVGEALAESMARAALELPDPVRVVEGIDPRRETSRLALVLVVALYKGKRSLSNFVAKQLVRRVAPRSAARALAPLIALPITGAWNALVSWRICREAKVRVVGPSAVEEVTTALLLDAHLLDEPVRATLVRAVATAMVSKEAAHPNLLALLRGVAARVGSVRAVELDDPERFLAELGALAPVEQRRVLAILDFAAILDGKLGRRTRRLVLDARVRCGLSADISSVEDLRIRFIAGDPIEPRSIE